LPGQSKSIASLCCGVRNKMDNSVLNKGTTCDAAFRQNSLITCFDPCSHSVYKIFNWYTSFKLDALSSHCLYLNSPGCRTFSLHGDIIFCHCSFHTLFTNLFSYYKKQHHLLLLN